MRPGSAPTRGEAIAVVAFVAASLIVVGALSGLFAKPSSPAPPFCFCSAQPLPIVFAESNLSNASESSPVRLTVAAAAYGLQVQEVQFEWQTRESGESTKTPLTAEVYSGAGVPLAAYNYTPSNWNGANSGTCPAGGWEPAASALWTVGEYVVVTQVPANGTYVEDVWCLAGSGHGSGAIDFA